MLDGMESWAPALEVVRRRAKGQHVQGLTLGQGPNAPGQVQGFRAYGPGRPSPPPPSSSSSSSFSPILLALHLLPLLGHKCPLLLPPLLLSSSPPPSSSSLLAAREAGQGRQYRVQRAPEEADQSEEDRHSAQVLGVINGRGGWEAERERERDRDRQTDRQTESAHRKYALIRRTGET